MNGLYEQLNDLYKLHIAAREFQHGIKKVNNCNWKLFIPSRFVYAFFAFNSFYSIDWEKSANEKRLIKWNLLQNGEESADKKTESQKISKLRKFIYNTYVNDNLHGTENDIAKNEFASKVSEKLKRYLEPDYEEKIKSLDDIVTDINISKDWKSRFIEELKNLLDNKLRGKKFNKALDFTLKFVYEVRNNIFHGTKTVIDMMDKGQQKRLQVYTAILLSINEMLFEAIEKRFEWTKKDIDINLRSTK